MNFAKPGWTRGSLVPAGKTLDKFAVGSVELKEGSPLRLRGVLGRVGRAAAEWIFLVENHAMHGDSLQDHMGELAETRV